MSPGLRPRPSLSAAGKFPGRRRRGIVSRQPASTRRANLRPLAADISQIGRSTGSPRKRRSGKALRGGRDTSWRHPGVGSSAGAHASLSALGVSLDAIVIGRAGDRTTQYYVAARALALATGGGARPLPPLPSLAVAVIAGAAHAKVPGKCIGPTAVASLAIAMSSDAAARGGAASRRGGCAEWTSCSRSSGMPPRVMYAIQDRHSLPVTPGSPPSRSGCRPGVRHGDALVPVV